MKIEEISKERVFKFELSAKEIEILYRSLQNYSICTSHSPDGAVAEVMREKVNNLR